MLGWCHTQYLSFVPHPIDHSSLQGVLEYSQAVGKWLQLVLILLYQTRVQLEVETLASSFSHYSRRRQEMRETCSPQDSPDKASLRIWLIREGEVQVFDLIYCPVMKHVYIIVLHHRAHVCMRVRMRVMCLRACVCLLFLEGLRTKFHRSPPTVLSNPPGCWSTRPHLWSLPTHLPTNPPLTCIHLSLCLDFSLLL